MSKYFIPLLLFLSWCSCMPARADKAVPVIHLMAADIVQDSIKQVHWGTNNTFAVKWRYTETGAKRMVAFWGRFPQQKVCIQVGSFKTPPFVAPGLENPVTHEDWRDAWIQRGTDQLINLSESDAHTIVEGLKLP